MGQMSEALTMAHMLTLGCRLMVLGNMVLGPICVILLWYCRNCDIPQPCLVRLMWYLFLVTGAALFSHPNMQSSLKPCYVSG